MFLNSNILKYINIQTKSQTFIPLLESNLKVLHIEIFILGVVIGHNKKKYLNTKTSELTLKKKRDKY